MPNRSRFIFEHEPPEYEARRYVQPPSVEGSHSHSEGSLRQRLKEGYQNALDILRRFLMGTQPAVGPDMLELLHRFEEHGVIVTDVLVAPDIAHPREDSSAGSYWLRFELSSGEVEGKLHLPEQRSDKILIYEPGFPGDGSTRFEQLHVKQLLKEGYVVFAVRHNGTLINGDLSSIYIDCPARQSIAEQEKQEVLGRNLPHTIACWLREPLVSVQALGLALTGEIYLVGHSFGALAILHSLFDLQQGVGNELRRVKQFLSLSGAVGRLRQNDDPILALWRAHLDTEWARQRVRVGDTATNLEILRQAYTQVHRDAGSFPEWIHTVFITPYGDTPESVDELISPLQSIDMISSLRRGWLVVDKTESADEAAGRTAHDMLNLGTSVLLDCLRGSLPAQGYITIVGA